MPRSRAAGTPRSDELLVGLAALAVLGLGVQTLPRQPTAAPVAAQAVVAAPVARAAAAPARLSITRLGVEQPLVPLGRAADGSLEVPSDYAAVGVWTGAPAGGPVVMAGHVDSEDGPAVFHRLRDLAAGDEVVVRDATGADRTYVVERVEQHAKQAFPTFSVFTGQGLRLITCGGAFDRRQRSYRDNLVVYARPA